MSRCSIGKMASMRLACCCTCAHHKIDASHPETDGMPISHQRGWVCLAPEFGRVFSGWGEHGLCEMWDLNWYQSGLRQAYFKDLLWQAEDDVEEKRFPW